MKRLPLLSALIIPLLVVAGFIVVTKTKEPPVTFYKTPLVCNAAPTIGCGSRSKPALLELEKNPAVKEAWLNRPGTVVAIVWKDKEQTRTVAGPIFDKNNIPFAKLNEKEAAPYRETFRKTNLWYRGADVDMLSREEAATIAESAVKWALESKLITAEEAGKIKTDVEAYFKQELVKIRTNNQLNDDSQHRFREALYSIAQKYIGKERTEKAMDLYQKNNEKQCKKDGSCTQPGAIAFYDVPLVCPGAPEIGCGTKAKPILLEMEKNPSIKEAWLNGAGTVIAVVWNENAPSEVRSRTADAIFKENKMDVTLIEGEGYKKIQADFQGKKNWYHGEDVNKLSMEEEGIIADRLLKRVNSKTPLSQEKTQSLKAEFVAALVNRFTKNYTSEFNSNPKVMENAIQESENELLEIGKKHLTDPEMNALKEAMALGLLPAASEKSCGSEDKKKESCCSKK